MKANVYEGHIGEQRKWVLVNDDYLFYPFEQSNWGFTGSGSALLARAIMMNEYGRTVPQERINLFLETRVAKWPGRSEWTLTSAEIEAWLGEMAPNPTSEEAWR